MKDINILIHNFIIFLRNSWKHLQTIFSYDQTSSLKDDWLQANWELLVEGFLLEEEQVYLEVYGDGADINGSSSRVLYEDKLPTHIVHCIPKKNKTLTDCLTKKEVLFPKEGASFDRFVSMEKNNWYIENIPFNKALVVLQNKEIVIDVDDLDFILIRLPRAGLQISEVQYK